MNKLYVAGIGPGAYEEMTLRVVHLLGQCDVIVGYTVYIDLIREHFPGKRFLSTPMRGEEVRCRMAFEQAQAGRTTAVVCSGDPGVYGMAGLVLEIGREFPETEIEIVPGVTAAGAGAALLGAPLMHDFAVISLSDLLTPWEKIEKRLAAAAAADFVICIYNPGGKSRKDYLKRACDLILPLRSPDTPCGLARRISREGESTYLCTLKELRNVQTDMFTTVFIGNSETQVIGGRLVTPRGYRLQANHAQESERGGENL